MEKIIHKEKLVAIKISSINNGSIPVTESDGALQVLTLKHKKGKVVASHFHVPQQRETQTLQECIVVIAGRIRVYFLDDDNKEFAQVDITTGEACIILSGYHSVEFLEDSEAIEIKNGPFIEDRKDFAV